MLCAYSLRKGTQKGVLLKDMGGFLGSLLLRTYARARRVSAAIACRSAKSRLRHTKGGGMKYYDYIFLSACVFTFTFLRFVNVSRLLGKLFI